MPTHLPLGQELTQMGQQKRQQKMAEVKFSSSSPMADPSGSPVATGQQSTNYRAEAYALLAAAQTLNQEERLPTNTMFLINCQSILQSLRSPGGDQIFSGIKQELSLLKNKTSVTLQWIPSHCGVGGNEEADRLSKKGSKLEQSAQPMSYSEAMTVLRNNFRAEWRQRLNIGSEEESIHHLDRAAQVTIFRRRTRHCQLLSHLHRLKISHSDECPCGTGPQTSNHTLQSCPTFDALFVCLFCVPQLYLWGSPLLGEIFAYVTVF